jgi:hypothetical protein
MRRLDPRILVLAALLLLTGACGDDPEPSAPAPVSPSVTAPASAVPASPSAAVPQPSDSVYVEEDDEPTAAPGDLSDQAQSYLDQALGMELGALEQAPAETAGPRRKLLEKLPENPTKVLAALKNYPWYSPEARALYDRATAAG